MPELPELKYWNVGIPQGEQVNRYSLQKLARKSGFRSVGGFLVYLVERYVNDPSLKQNDSASVYSDVNKDRVSEHD